MDIHDEDFELRLALKLRLKCIQKWPTLSQISSENIDHVANMALNNLTTCTTFEEIFFLLTLAKFFNRMLFAFMKVGLNFLVLS